MTILYQGKTDMKRSRGYFLQPLNLKNEFRLAPRIVIDGLITYSLTPLPEQLITNRQRQSVGHAKLTGQYATNQYNCEYVSPSNNRNILTTKWEQCQVMLTGTSKD